ncbi:MAG: CTP synthase [Saprospiraceae bacterium]|nr:CTP synthase [Saprospiraceae bacterium]MBK9632848.1 CTP synthase [Saprospiraceae bacterium]
MTKYIFVTGGVTSSLGKGIIAASLAKLLQGHGFKVTIQKFDPYINVDPGTLNPYEHGECYVTDDGAETDLDLGHYERFLNISTSQANNVTTGRIYQTVINKERAGEFLGKTVQVIPHITDEIKRRMLMLSEKGFDIIITELGGTVGDIESLPYLEALRQLRMELGEHHYCTVHLTLIPYLAAAKELKTKPTQHSVKELQESGVQPNILVCRTEKPISDDIRQKLALFCNLKKENVIEALDADTIYEVPLLMLKEKLDIRVLKELKLKSKGIPELKAWREFLKNLRHPIHEVTIGLIGKYNELPDAYKSIYESFIHSGAANQCKVNVKAIHSESLENPKSLKSELSGLDGLLVAPGFGERGIEGKIESIKFARENKIPFLGICLGMQCAVVEFARNVMHLKNAASTEVNPKTKNPVIHIMPDQLTVTKKGGTMRLGAYDCKLIKGSKAFQAYKKSQISERHRHRYEFNSKYLKEFNEHGMVASGINPAKNLVEIIELKNHPWFVGVQFHPELKSTVENPHPLFVNFVLHCIKNKKK